MEGTADRTRQLVRAALVPSVRATTVSVAVAFVGGLAVRLWLLGTSIGRLDSDEAVTALMAEELHDGRMRVFFWGQDYGGSLDAIITAPVTAVTGPSVVAAKLVMVACHLAGCLMVGWLGRRWFDTRTGALAAATAWVVSPGVVWFSTKTRGFYGSGLVLALAVVFVTARLVDRRTEPSAPTWSSWRRPRDLDSDGRDLVVLGLVTGLGWWVSPIVFFLAGPALVVLVAARVDLARRVGWTVPGFLVGASPWLAVNLTQGFPSLDQPPAAVSSTYWSRLEGFVDTLVPTLVGLRAPYSQEWVGGPAGPVVAVAVMIGLVVVAWALRRRTVLPLVLLVGYGLVFAVPQTTQYVAEPRYGYLLAPVIALILARALAPVPVVGSLLPVVLLVTTTVGLVSLRDWGRDHPGHWDLNPPAVDELETVLADAGVDAVYADYWIAYRLAYETSIEASPTEHVRNPDLADDVARALTDTYVHYAGSPQATQLVAALEADGIDAATTAVGPYVVVEVGG